MELEMKENDLTVKDYQRLRTSVGWSVLPEYQGRGIGKSMIERVISYVNQQGFPGTNITLALFSAMGKEGFYQKQGFRIRPNDNRGAGMEMILPVHQDTGA